MLRHLWTLPVLTRRRNAGVNISSPSKCTSPDGGDFPLRSREDDVPGRHGGPSVDQRQRRPLLAGAGFWATGGGVVSPTGTLYRSGCSASSMSTRGSDTLTICWPVRVSVRTNRVMAGIIMPAKSTPKSVSRQRDSGGRIGSARHRGVVSGRGRLGSGEGGRARHDDLYGVISQRSCLDPKMNPNSVFGGFRRPRSEGRKYKKCLCRKGFFW